MTPKNPPSTEHSGGESLKSALPPQTLTTPAPASAGQAAPGHSPSNHSASGQVERVVQLYGDLIFDLCESVLWSPINAQLVFRAIIKLIRSRRRGHGFIEHERAWVLQIACEKLLQAAARHGRKLTSSEQIQLDSTQNIALKLKQFDAYFHRLLTEDQILLLLRDKYGMPYPEIAAALGLPEGTLKIRRVQALRSLEEWLWDSK